MSNEFILPNIGQSIEVKGCDGNLYVTCIQYRERWIYASPVNPIDDTDIESVKVKLNFVDYGKTWEYV